MRRLLFEKTGKAIWISHLDLMRLFQRAFQRAGLPLTHTQGFNPRPSVSIALPLSVGIESHCELLDFELEGEAADRRDICQRLNRALTEGIRVREVYDSGRKLKELTLLESKIILEYDRGIPLGAGERIAELFRRSEVTVPKKSKNGIQDQNIVTMIRRIACHQTGEKELELNALVCCQNPTLNPVQIVTAIGMYLPDDRPDFSRCSRIEIYDTQENVFR